jgi:hypothetical protein
MPRLRRAGQSSEACILEKDGRASQEAPDILLLPTKSITQSDGTFDENDKENVCSINGQAEKKSRGKGRAKPTKSAAADVVAESSKIDPANHVECDGESRPSESLDSSERRCGEDMPAADTRTASTSTARQCIGRPSMAAMAAMPVRQRKLMFMEAAKSGSGSSVAMDFSGGGRSFPKKQQALNMPKTGTPTATPASNHEEILVVAIRDDDEPNSPETARSPSSSETMSMSIASAVSMLHSATITMTDLRSTGMRM